MLDVLVLAQDIATAACGSFNAIHFLGYWLAGTPPGRGASAPPPSR